MSQFQFYQNCTFCQSRIGSTHCLLPYQLVKLYVQPEDEVSRIIEITEIHMRYGIEALEANFKSTEWIKSYLNSRQTSNPSVQSSHGPSNWFEEMNEQNLFQETTEASSTSTQDDAVSIGYSEYITSQLDFSVGEGVTIDSEASEVIPQKTFTEVVKSKASSNDESEIPAELLSAPEPEIPSKGETNAVQQYEQAQLRQYRNHAISDLVLMAKAAFNIHSNQRGGIKTNALKESLMHESNIRSMTGLRYQPTRNTTLDGNKAIAKELIATHSSEDVQNWESGKITTHGQYCILNTRFISLPVNEDDASKLGEDLVICFINMLKGQTRSEGVRNTLIQLLEFELERAGHPSTFQWINNRYTFLENRKPKEKKFSFLESSQLTTKKEKEPYPNVDQRLTDYINTHLQVIINRKIESPDYDLPVMSDETKLSKFLFKLASEFLLRNKGWHNENSFVKPHHLTKLEELTGLKSKASEAFLTFNILKAIINDFRLSFKKRYPKGTTGME